MGLQGVVSPVKLQANAAAPLIYIAQSLGAGGWAKVTSHWPARPLLRSGRVVGIVAAGVILMLMARFILRSSFFQVARESAAREG
jgi:hypothetical protein